MVIFFVYIIFLSIYEITIICDGKKKDKMKSIVIYSTLIIFCISIGIYYYKNMYSGSLAQLVFNIFNINY